MAEPTDEDLVRSTLAGNSDAFGELMRRHRGSAYSLAYRLVGDPDAAQDVAQETFLRAYRKLSTFRPGGSFTAWLLTIASRLGIDHLRRTKRRPLSTDQAEEEVGIEVVDEGPGPEQTTLNRSTASAVEKAITRLPDAQRTAVTLRHIHDLSYEEIAEAMGIPEGTAKSHVHRGRRALRRSLAPLVEELA